MPCSFEFEDALRAKGIVRIAGIDEAGRGPLAGPVVAAAVFLPPGFDPAGLDDSKKISDQKRQALYHSITSNPDILWSVAQADSEEIDRINILRATHLAMRSAALALTIPPEHVLIDGLPVHPFPFPQTSVVKGDARCFSIAAASILAKVTRDRIMLEFDSTYPEYGFAKHKGYGTALHLKRIQQHGTCPIHRKSFAPVANQLLLIPPTESGS